MIEFNGGDDIRCEEEKEEEQKASARGHIVAKQHQRRAGHTVSDILHIALVTKASVRRKHKQSVSTRCKTKIKRCSEQMEAES